MIISFSGTGNSQYFATLLGHHLNEMVVPLVSQSPLNIEFCGDSLGFVFPVYSWGVPPIVNDYIKGLNESFILEARKHPVWVVMVCGDETGNAPDMFRKILRTRELYIKGGWSVQMPNNYVILPGFDVDPRDVEEKKLSKIPGKAEEISSRILKGEWEKDFVYGRWAALKTGLVYPLFKKWGIFPSKWRYTDKCISCGKCSKACPVNNISMSNNSNGKSYPLWGNECISCLACYHVCPNHAIEYGQETLNKGQYFLGTNR